MINENYLSKDHGLLNSTHGRDGTDENAPLYLQEWLLLNTVNSGDRHGFSVALGTFIAECRTATRGLYHQRPNNNGSKEDYMSPDQLIAFVSYLKNTHWLVDIEDIWSYLKRNLFTYDNLTGKINFKRLMQPLAVSFVGASVGSRFWKWVLIKACRKACREFEKNPEPESSGVLKAFTCLRSLGIRDEYCEQFYTKAFEVYFPDENHPIRKLL